jgi:hypothetical protein
VPAGLAFSSGAITGTPTATASTTLVVKATDFYGCTGTVSYPLTIKTMGIGNLVFDDCNNNGVFDGGDTGLAGALVQLFSPGADNAIGGTGVNADTQIGASITTTSTGAYSFTNIPPGNYFVKVTPPSTHQKTGGTPVTLDNQIDNDNNGTQSALGAPLFSPIITLSEGAEPTTDGDTDANTDLTVDFGVFKGLRVGSHVWADANQDGAFQVGTETGIGGLTVQLMSPGADNAIGGTGGNADTVVASTTTSASGAYSFLIYTPGNYFVAVLPNATYALPSLNPVSADNNIDNDNNAASQPGGAGTAIYSPMFTLTDCETDNTIDFGLRPCPVINVSPLSIPALTQFVPTTTTLTASGGNSPYTWSVLSGALPAGISLTSTGATTATVAGNPSAVPGTYNVTIRARDALGCVADVAYPIIVNCAGITIAPGTISTATMYASYSQVFTASTSGTSVPAQTYTWSLTGTLPSGISFNTTTATLSGTPNASSTPGNYPITVRVQNQNACFATQGYTLTVNCPTIPITGVLPNGTQDTVYPNTTLSASGGTAPYTRSIVGAMPTGLVIDPNTGVVSGTPTVVQSATFNVVATDAKGCTGVKPCTIAIACPVITISPATLSSVTQYTAMTPVNFSAVGGRTPYAWSINAATPLPAGLSFNNGTATLSGTPTAAPGAYSFIVDLVDNSGCPGSAAYTLTVNCNTITISPGSLPAGTVGTPYSQMLTASMAGTSVPVQTWTWSLNSGTLPAGLLLNTSTGAITGTPTVAGNSTVTLRASNTDGCYGTLAATITVSCPTMTISPASLATATQYQPGYSQAMVVTGGKSPYTWSITGALPAGITLNTSTGTLSGTPTASGAAFPITVTVADSFGCTSTKAYTLNVQSLDYGDASSLPSASAIIDSGLKLGALIDADPPGQTNALADADDNASSDDEDGVTFAPFTMGNTALVSTKVTNTTAAPAYLNGWIDFNGNGVLEASERVISDQVITAGSSNLSFDVNVPVPATAFNGFVMARFRITSLASPGSSGLGGTGEVEDYRVQICEPRPCGKTFVTKN